MLGVIIAETRLMVKDKSTSTFVNIGVRAICTIFMEEGAIETSNPDLPQTCHRG